MVNFMRALKALVDRVPHWVLIVFAAGVGAALSYIQAVPSEDLLAALTTPATLRPILVGAGTAAIGTMLALLRTAPWTAAPDTTTVRRPPGTPPPLPVLLLALALAVALVACARDPMTPLDHALIANETDDDVGCVIRYREAGTVAVDACRSGVRRAWDGYWTAALTDAGGDR